MAFDIKIVRGPQVVQGFSKEAAAEKLVALPGFPANAQYTIEEINGQYIAAVVSPKTAEFPPSPDDESGPPAPEGPPSDDSEESGPPKSDEEKKDDGPPSSEGAPKEEGKQSVDHQLANLTDMLTKITDALGLSTPADSMVPGADEGPPGLGPDGPPPGLEEGTGEDPSMGKKPGIGSDNKMHTVHERSLKPGEAPPGTTPVGAPSFASVRVEDGHPWKDAIEAGVKEIEVESVIGNSSISTVAAELKGYAEPYGYIVTDLAPKGAGDQRTASARIVRTR
jgi:hypothetical protein